MTSKLIKALPQDPGVSGWEATLPQWQPGPTLEERKTADFLVIGAGFAGISAAKRLSHQVPDAKVVVLEASEIALGPSGRNSGFMIDLPHDLQSDDYGSGPLDHERLEIQDNRMGIEFAALMAEEANLPTEAFDRCGKYNAAATSKGMDHIDTYSKQLARLGEDHQVLDATDMKAVTGTSYYQQGLFTPGVVMIQPAAFIRAAAKVTRSNRVQLHENSPVTALERRGQDWTATTPKGTVTAPKVILAVNGHLNSFGYAKRQVMHVHTYGSMTRALTDLEIQSLGGLERWGITSADPLGTSVRKITWNGEHRIIVRNRTTYDPNMAVNDARVAQMGKTHDASFIARFPMLKDVSMEYRWGGRLALTRNGVSVFGELDDNLYSANVQNGLGTAKGTFQGIMAADLACGLSSEPLQRLMSQSMPTQLMPPPFMHIGAAGYLRWLEIRAGKEL